jgi:hypothetical protein
MKKQNRATLILIGVLSVGLLGLSACIQKRGFNDANVSSYEIGQMNAIDSSLKEKGIEVQPSNQDDKRTIPAKLTSGDLDTVREQLTRYKKLGTDVLAKVEKMSDSSNREEILSKAQNGVDNANDWLEKIDKRKSELKK